MKTFIMVITVALFSIQASAQFTGGGDDAGAQGSGGTEKAAYGISVSSKWNLVSVPLSVPDYLKSSLFPTSTSSAVAWQGGYQNRDTLENRIGYWLKFASAQNINMDGSVIVTDSIPVVQGWNLIGSISDPVAVSSVIPVGTTVVSRYYGFANGYTSAPEIEPGKGHWVKTSGAGTLVLGAGGLLRPAPQPDEKFLVSLNRLTIVSSDGGLLALSFGVRTGEPDMNFLELPPTPPEGIFDVRFGSGRFAELFDMQRTEELRFPIRMQGVQFPATVRWEISGEFSGGVWLEDNADGNLFPAKRMTGTGSLVLSDPRMTELVLRVGVGENVPARFGLGQNYPNPFNPATIIRYEVPREAHVSISLFNLLGQKVAVLVDETMSAGFHRVTVDATSFASGVYFYRMRATAAGTAERYESVLKLIVLK